MQGLPAWQPGLGPAGERQLWRISELSALMIYIASFEAGKKRATGINFDGPEEKGTRYVQSERHPFLWQAQHENQFLLVY